MSAVARGRDDAHIAAAHDGFQTRIFLQPIAPPSILGLAGFSGATLIVAMNLAGWFGNALTPTYLFPFAFAYGGIAQFAAGLWAYRARDAVATLAHGTWGAFWIGYGILNAFIAAGAIPPPAPHVPLVGFGLWFIPLAYVTLTAAIASLAESVAIFGVLVTLGIGSALAAGGLMSGGIGSGWSTAAGWVFVISACIAWYAFTAMLLVSASGRTILPLGKYQRAANVPGERPVRPIELEWAEPGIKKGQ